MVPSQMPQRWEPKQPARVLVAEDDPDMRGLMAWALRQDGYEVREVRDGAEALVVLGTVDESGKAGAPDLIVSDVRMPGLGGMEMLERLRRGSERIPVILVTAFGDWETHARAARLSAKVLDKPFELEDLRKMVFDALEL